MVDQFFERADEKSLQQFKRICNELLCHTFIVQRLYDKDTESRHNNKDYLFLLQHREWFEAYLSLLDWHVVVDDYNGFAYVYNQQVGNKLSLNKQETILLLGLRLLYEEAAENLGMDNDALYTVKDLLDVVVTDNPLIKGKPNMKEVSRTLSLFEKYHIVQVIQGKMNRLDGQFAIMPTITYVVNGDMLDRIINEYVEDIDEETGTDTAH